MNTKNIASIIKIFGVGGGGCNAVNHMYRAGIKDVCFVVCNTDLQALHSCPVPSKIQLGVSLTGGLGAGNKPETGRNSAIENISDIEAILMDNTKMVFITAGMGGGTGTGAAPVIAGTAHSLGILTVGIVTLPFRFEGQRRFDQAINGINEMKNYVDSLLVINNEKLREMQGDLKISEAFANADNILTVAAKAIAEIITVHGYVNVDFADVYTVMKNSGVAIMGSGRAGGTGRALKAVQQALTSPLLDNNDIAGSKNVLMNICSGADEVTLDELGIITDYVQELAGTTTNIIWGNSTDLSLNDDIAVTVIATGFSSGAIPDLLILEKQNKSVFDLKLAQSGQYDEAPASLINQPSASHDKEKQSQGIKTTFIETVKSASQTKTERQTQPKSFNAREKVNPQIQANLSFSFSDENHKDDLKNMESVPAYLRRKKMMNDQLSGTKEEDLSGRSLVNTDDGKVEIRDNAFLKKEID
jgi:cell division protein FtsZ